MFTKLPPALAILAVAVVGVALTFTSRAATPFASLEPEQGTLAAGATTGTDSTASGGQFVQFGGGVDPAEEFPTPQTTGPRTTELADSEGITSTAANQIIERKNVTGRVTIKHDNVTVRDVKVNGTGTYMITVAKKADGNCPANARFEYIEIDGALAAENDIPVYATCGFVLDRAYIHNVGRSSRLTNNTTVQNSYVFSNRTGDSGAHRGAVGTNGGSNNVIRNNVLRCQGKGCSAAIPMYGDFAPVDGLLVEHNLLATTGSYCMYGGTLASKTYPEGSNIKIINNRFSREFGPNCGQFGTLSGWEGGVRGNESSGNVWYETGEPIIFAGDTGV